MRKSLSCVVWAWNRIWYFCQVDSGTSLVRISSIWWVLLSASRLLSSSEGRSSIAWRGSRASRWSTVLRRGFTAWESLSEAIWWWSAVRRRWSSVAARWSTERSRRSTTEWRASLRWSTVRRGWSTVSWRWSTEIRRWSTVLGRWFVAKSVGWSTVLRWWFVSESVRWGTVGWGWSSAEAWLTERRTSLRWGAVWRRWGTVLGWWFAAETVSRGSWWSSSVNIKLWKWNCSLFKRYKKNN